MLISEIKDNALRVLALDREAASRPEAEPYGDDLDHCFPWTNTEEGWDVWNAVNRGTITNIHTFQHYVRAIRTNQAHRDMTTTIEE